ncbi:MAG: endo alpha-1,4 polygalactosaminidase [Epsilonproteobacteria bacterium]|nr:endo alpha-1,4 polygalactosaminidase [Campylobacterota bacterium]
MWRRNLLQKITLSISLLLLGCGSTNSDVEEPKTWYLPTIDTSWQWQLKDTLNTSYDVQLYDIDLFDSSKELIASLQNDGKKVICYFSAGSYENWREDANTFPTEVLGDTLDGWEDEQWLDIRSEKLQSIMTTRLDLAKEKGCDGVEPDNMDGYTNSSGFSLSSNDQLTYNKFIAQEAHDRNLSIGLKNDLNQIEALEPYFDFAVNEQCHFYNECELMQPFIDADKPVFNTEYAERYVNNKNGARDEMCQKSQELKIQTLVLPLDLDDSFRYSCD